MTNSKIQEHASTICLYNLLFELDVLAEAYFNMDVPVVIPSLEELAFEVSFKDFLRTLLLGFEHRPQGERFSCLASSAF